MINLDFLLVSGFLEGAGEALFGTESKKQGKKAQKEALKAMKEGQKMAKGASSEAKDVQKQAEAAAKYAKSEAQYAGAQARGYDKATQASMGANAADYMRKANAAAQGQAAQAAGAASEQGSRAAIRAARTAGLNKGQAALTAGQGAADTYSNTYQSGLESGRQQYQAGTQQFAQQGASMANRQLGQQSAQTGNISQANTAVGNQIGASGVVGNIASGQASAGAGLVGQGNQSFANTMGMIGGIAGALSDEEVKDNIVEVPTADAKKEVEKAVSTEAAKTETTPEKKYGWKDLSKDVGEIFKGVSTASSPNHGQDTSSKSVAMPTSYGENAGDAFSKGFSTGKSINKSFTSGGVDKALEQSPVSSGSGGGAEEGGKMAAVGSMLAKAGPVLAAFSDERLKKDIKDSPRIEDILKKIRPVTFEYKEEVGVPGQKVGVIAQDLEKTALKNVVRDTPAGKVIDGPQLATADLNLIIQLASEVAELKKRLGER